MRKTVLPFVFALVALAASARAQQQPPPAAAPPPAPARESCGCEGEPVPEEVAVVNGIKIGIKDIEEPIKTRVEELRRQVVEARRREVDLQINSLLLEAEAKKRGVSATKLLETEIITKTREPTDAEAQAFYDQNKARINADFATVKKDIVEYLRSQREREAAGRFAQSLRAAAQVVVTVPEATPPATPADRARVFATVNGKQITSGMVEDSLKPLVFAVQQELYSLRKQQLDLRINDILLEQEAQKRKITTNALLDAEVRAKLKTVTEADAQVFYNENKERINGEFAQIKHQIVAYLQEQEGRKQETAFANRLRAASSVQINLRAPESPVFQISTDDQPSRGAATAPVTIVEFTDFQCPSCAQTHPVLERIVAEYGDRVRLVVRDYPLSQHANAQKAAEAAEAARAQGRYWEFTRLLYANQSALDVAKLKEYATQLGLDRQKFDAALDSGQFAEKVQRDVDDGNRLGVNGTPTLFVNGRRVDDRSYEGLKATVEAALKEKAKN